ncbi:MAG: cyclic nucleotide-binding domain-containing protein [Alphaproteobacteria bacterium]
MRDIASIATNLEFSPHDPIIDEGEPAGFLYNVTGGTVRLYKLLPDGRRQITGFLNNGDFMGIALNNSYSYSAEAVDRVKVCRFARGKLEVLLDKYPHLERRMLGLASNELIQAQDQMMLLGRKTAKEKIVTFLLSLSKRQLKIGGKASPVALPMSRTDIADYLGLTTETVSRTFSLLKRDHAIRIEQGGMVSLPDIEALQDVADGY